MRMPESGNGVAIWMKKQTGCKFFLAQWRGRNEKRLLSNPPFVTDYLDRKFHYIVRQIS